MKKLILKNTEKAQSVLLYFVIILLPQISYYGGLWLALFIFWCFQRFSFGLQLIPKFYIHTRFHLGNYLIWALFFIWLGWSILTSTKDMSDKRNFWLVVIPIIWLGCLMIRHQYRYSIYLQSIILLLECIFFNKHLNAKDALIAMNRENIEYDEAQLEQMLVDLQKNNFITYEKEDNPDITYCIKIILPEFRVLALEKREVEEWECESCGAINNDNGLDEPICEYCGTVRQE